MMVLASVIGAIFCIWLLIISYGLWRRAQGLRPFNASEQERNAAALGAVGRHVVTPDGRVIEYLVYGSQQPDAKVIVQIHGAGMTAGSQCSLNDDLCKKLNLKGIAPSMPGSGFSDIQPERIVADFPKDIEWILDAEGVDEFMVEGTSLGTSHAMAVAWYFGPKRCIAMGLNVPYISEQICQEYDVDLGAAAHIPKTGGEAWYQAWNFLVADLMYLVPGISPPARHLHRLQGGQKMKAERPWIIDTFAEDHRRLVLRGTQGQAWEQFSFKMNMLWGFDPREIATKNVAIWYAKDDTASPAPHGKWLAEFFGAKEDINTDIRGEDIGLGHFTYFPSKGPQYQLDERSLPATLLALCDRP